MSDNFQDILDGLLPKLPRSRLEPYRGLIDKLRRRGRTYREIVDILSAKCGRRVSVSMISFAYNRYRSASGRIAKPLIQMEAIESYRPEQ